MFEIIACEGAPDSTKQLTYRSYVCPHREYQFDIDENKKTGRACVLLHQILAWEESTFQVVRHRMVLRVQDYHDIWMFLNVLRSL